MIVGVGIDVVELDRIQRTLHRFGHRFLHRILTVVERAGLPETEPGRSAFTAARFAAKEAGAKALGTGMSQGVGWHDFEVSPQPSGRPLLILHGRAREVASSMGIGAAHISLTHGRDVAAAVVILETG